jgi:type II secretory ATPase GspE/PulE/Tfp pilus assembly ATPase PilB-like protein
VVRLPAELSARRTLDELGLPPGVLGELKRFAAVDQGLLLVTGPAGAGKTTTIYTLLRHIAATQPGLSLVTIEDPVESQLPGVTQIQVTDHGPLDYAAALRSVLRQDPQVLMLGEIRDAATASIAVQAALSGHRLIATMHAGSPAAAIARLLEMGLEPYQVTSAVDSVLTQRLLRRTDGAGGYLGRIPIAELARMSAPLRTAITVRADTDALTRVIAAQSGYQTLLDAARQAVTDSLTDISEVNRVLGTDLVP